MKPRSLSFQPLEDRQVMDAAPVTAEFLPSVYGTVEARGANWDAMHSGDGVQVHPSSTQTGIQYHQPSSTYYEWEGLTEFAPNIPVGAVVESATLQVRVQGKENTMNRPLTVVAQVSTQDQAGAIVASEFGNASGNAIGSAAFDSMAIGQQVRIALDPSIISRSSPVSIVLRTSDQAAGQRPATDHNSRSVFSYAEPKLLIRYSVPAPAPAPSSTPVPADTPEGPSIDLATREIAALISEALVLAEPEWRAATTLEISTAVRSDVAVHVQTEATNGLTVGVRAQIAPIAGASVNAYVFRGSTQIAVVPVTSVGSFEYEYDLGITDVVFRTTAKNTLAVSNVQLCIDQNELMLSASNPTTFTSREFAIATATATTVPANVATFAKQMDYTMSPGGSGERRFYDIRDPSLYTMYRITYSSGSGRLSTVGSIIARDYWGTQVADFGTIPAEYIRWIDPNTVLIAPGAPGAITFVGGFYKAIARLQKTEGLTAEALMPPARMTKGTVNVNVLTMDAQSRPEGVFAGATQVAESAAPVFEKAGQTVNVKYNVHNTALTGGQLTMDVYVSWYAGEPLRGMKQDSFTFSMAANETKMVSVNVTAPGKPSDATSDRPIICTVVRMPDGTTSSTQKLGAAADSMDTRVSAEDGSGGKTLVWVSKEYSADDQLRLQRQTARAVDALLTSSNPKLTAVRDVLGEDHLVSMLATVTNNAIQQVAALPETSIDKAVQLALLGEEEKIQLTAGIELLTVAYNTTISSVSWINSLSTKKLSLQNGEFNNWDSRMIGMLKPNESGSVEFTVDSSRMLNIAIEKLGFNARLTLKRSDGSIALQSEWRKAGSYLNSLSMSAEIGAGTYTLYIERDGIASMGPQVFDYNYVDNKTFELAVSIEEPSRKIIRGVISRDGQSEVQEVQIRNFVLTDIGDMEKNIEDIPAIDISKPTWVIVHGMDNHEGTETIQDLAKAFLKHGGQVLIIDWKDAAEATIPGSDAPWTVPVGQWIARRLIQMGFDPSDINGSGHSHGTYVLYAMGKEIMRISLNKTQMNTIVALDPAGNSILTSGFNHYEINFGEVSRHSIAFESSLIADSNVLAGTADLSVRLLSPETFRITTEHQLGLTTFSEILRSEAGAFSEYFSYTTLMHARPEANEYLNNWYYSFFDMEMVISTEVKNSGTSKEYTQGMPLFLQYRGFDNTNTLIPF